MIALQPLRSLMFSAPAVAPPYLSAASGLVVAGDFVYVVADDELHLGVFDRAGKNGGSRVRLFPGDLPDEAAARKACKPDLEVLVRLPSFAGYPAGALLALGSGSRPNRQSGALLGLDDSGALSGGSCRVDLTALYAPLQRRFAALNIEGAVVCGSQLVLLQRASGSHPQNALIGFALADVLLALSAGDAPRLPELPAALCSVELGGVDGIPLGFTDAAALPDGRIVFSAVAEHVDDTYLDGPCVAAAIGIVTPEGQVQALQLLQPVYKVEGIDAIQDGDVIRLLLVTDADDRRLPAVLFSASLAPRPEDSQPPPRAVPTPAA